MGYYLIVVNGSAMRPLFDSPKGIAPLQFPGGLHLRTIGLSPWRGPRGAALEPRAWQWQQATVVGNAEGFRTRGWMIRVYAES